MLWPFKIIIKILIAHLPVPYQVWQRMGIFRHGRMDRAAYVQKIFSIHANRTFPTGLPVGSVVLELGPGDSLASCLLAKASGASKIFLSDIGPYASMDIFLYKKMSETWHRDGLETPDLSTCTSIDDMLNLCNATYLTQGIDSLLTLSDHSIDFSWSHSVLEHVRRHDFNRLMTELKRITKPGGFSSHIVDLQDHLDHSLNSLRFSENIWEADWFARGGFYTNRIQARDMIRLAEKAGFKVILTETGKWPRLPLPRSKMHRDFCALPEEELRIRSLALLLQA